MICNNCGTVFSEGRFCPNCGAAYSEMANNIPSNNFTKVVMPQKKKWYQKTWVIILLLIFVFPVGLFLMWKYKKNWKILVKLAITVIILFFTWSAVSPTGSDESSITHNRTKDNVDKSGNNSTTSSIYEGMPEKSIELRLDEKRVDIPEEITVSFHDVNDSSLKSSTQRANNKLIKKQKLLSVAYVDTQMIPFVDFGVEKIEEDVIASNAELKDVSAIASFKTDKGIKKLTDEKVYIWFRYLIRMYDKDTGNIIEDYRELKVSSTVEDAMDSDSYEVWKHDELVKGDFDLVDTVQLIAGANSPFYTHYTESGANGAGPSIYYSPDTNKVNYVRACEVSDAKTISNEIESKRGQFSVDDLQMNQYQNIEDSEATNFTFSEETYRRDEGPLSTIEIYEVNDDNIVLSLYIGGDGENSFYCKDSIVAEYNADTGEAVYEEGDYKLIIKCDKYSDDCLYVEEVNSKEPGLSFNGKYVKNSFGNSVIFNNSNYYLIDKDELEKYSSQKTVYYIGIYEIYARHGVSFPDPKLQAYFNECNWYEWKTGIDSFGENELNDIEKQNIQQLEEYSKN